MLNILIILLIVILIILVVISYLSIKVYFLEKNITILNDALFDHIINLWKNSISNKKDE